ncbi:MAG: DUF1735 domain-containing protein [Bacteroidales bacterium]|nr:DUF1735 domain-containing protein [Bacteroidales bacterium]
MKKNVLLASVLLPCLIAVSCDKEKGKDEVKPAQLGIEIQDAKEIYEVPKNQATTLNLAVVADPTSAEAYTITVGANPGLVSTYNTAHGTSYEMLPSNAYAFASTSVMLPRYSAKSTSIELRLKGEGCEIDKTYLLPVVIDGVQGGTNFSAPEDKAAYILFKMLKAEQTGAGTQADPYVIPDLESFLKINDLLKEEQTTYFKLGDDIDFTGVKFTDEAPWVPINTGEEDLAKARGLVLDGDGHSIKGFTGGGALIAYLVGGVQNLTIENADITCLDKNLGGVLAGAANDAFVKNVTVKNSKLVSDYKRNGGLIGYVVKGTAENCNVECEVTGNDQQAGGLFGRFEEGSITNCSASGNVTCATYYSGGLVGFVVSATIKDCHATGNVTHTAGNYSRAGGLVGQITGDTTIENCYATGAVTGTGHYGGGLVGFIGCNKDDSDAFIPQTTTISKCYATGNVTLATTNNFAHAGGLVGTVSDKATLNVSNCYATGIITVRRYSSGFVGTVSSADARLTVTNSYTTSNINGIALTTHCGLALGNNSAGAAGVSYTGFVAWNESLDDAHNRFCYPEENNIVTAGNYFGHDETVSAQATKLGWDTTIWDLSKDLPTLK